MFAWPVFVGLGRAVVLCGWRVLGLWWLACDALRFLGLGGAVIRVARLHISACLSPCLVVCLTRACAFNGIALCRRSFVYSVLASGVCSRAIRSVRPPRAGCLDEVPTAAQDDHVHRFALRGFFFRFSPCRRTLEGHLCAAAFVQNRKVYTGCTEAADPLGESGRPWCYVEAQARRRASRCSLSAVLALLARWLRRRTPRSGVCAVRNATGREKAGGLLCCAGPVQDYGALRAEAQAALRAEAAQARASVAKLNKAHAAAVQTLDM